MAGRDLADLQRERGREATVDHCQGTRARARRMCMACARHVHAMCTASPAARCMCYLPQAASWWQTAVRMLGVGSATLVGRADDDTFVVLPRLLAHLQQLGCVRHLCYGPMAYVGYNPATYAKCGWGWAGDGSYYRTYNLQPHAAPCSPLQALAAPCGCSQPLHSPCTGNYYKYLCEASGAQPPFPFPFGTLQARSSSGGSSGSSIGSSRYYFPSPSVGRCRC